MKMSKFASKLLYEVFFNKLDYDTSKTYDNKSI